MFSTLRDCGSHIPLATSDKLFEKVMGEVGDLETEGISVEIDGFGSKQLFSSIGQFVGNSLPVIQAFGLIESFSSGHFCPFCYVTKEDIDFFLRIPFAFGRIT